jgi:putative transposase
MPSSPAPASCLSPGDLTDAEWAPLAPLLPEPARSPNLNAYCERLVRAIKEEALDHTMMLGERSLSYTIQQDLAHYHHEQTHQGLAHQLMAAEPGMRSHGDQVRRRERLGGLLSYYYRDAA